MASQSDSDAAPENQAYTLLVCQNNDKKTLHVQHMSPALAQHLGYGADGPAGKDIRDIIGDTVREAVDDYVEFEDGMADLEQVLGRVRSFTLKGVEGNEQSFSLRILRDPAPDRHDWFRLILKDERRQIQDNSFLTAITDSIAGISAVDEASGLPDRHTAEQAVRVAAKYVGSHQLNACFAVIRIDRFEKSVRTFGKEPCAALLQHVAQCCRATFRTDDVIAALGEHTLGLVLLDITPDAARVVLNRLRWYIATHHIHFGGKSNFSVTVSVAFTALKESHGPELVDKAEQAVLDIHADERSALVGLD